MKLLSLIPVAISFLSKVPFLASILKIATGPFGILIGLAGDLIKPLIELVVEFARLFIEGLTVVLKNLSTLTVILVVFVVGFYQGVKYQASNQVVVTDAATKAAKAKVKATKDDWARHPLGVKR